MSKLYVQVVVFFIIFMLSASIGNEDFGFFALLRAILGRSGSGVNEGLIWNIVWNIRLPRVCLGALCGGSLAVAGVLSQGLFRNSLASPTVLGTSSGATLFTVASFYWGIGSKLWYMSPFAAACGAFCSTATLFLLVRRISFSRVDQVLLAGFSLSAFMGAFTSLFIALSLDEVDKSVAMMHWMFGGLSARGWDYVMLGLFPSFLGIMLAFYVSHKMDVLSLGVDVARTLGVHVERLKWQSLIAISLLVGSSVCAAGAIPFVGLIVPHITRKIVGPRNLELVKASFFNGMSLTIGADFIARTIRYPLEIEVGVFTSLIGAPFFLIMFLRGRR